MFNNLMQHYKVYDPHTHSQNPTNAHKRIPVPVRLGTASDASMAVPGHRPPSSVKKKKTRRGDMVDLFVSRKEV